DGDVREAARADREGSAGDDRRRREGRRAELRLVQLPPRACRHDDQAAPRRGEARAHLSLPREVPPGLDHLEGSAAGGRRAVGGGVWRLDVKVAGSGVTGDLLAHNIDTALWLNGPIVEVAAMTETFVKERKHTLTGKVEPVGIDDASAFLCRFENGSLATFEA